MLALGAGAVCAQSIKVPPTTRTVYKCQEGQKTVYSDAPCLGAQRIDVEPTRGLDKSSGQRMTGADVRAERTREQYAKIVQPALGMDAAENARDRQRARLSSSAKTECKKLDTDMAAAEARERADAKADLPATQRALLALRSRFKELRC